MVDSVMVQRKFLTILGSACLAMMLGTGVPYTPLQAAEATVSYLPVFPRNAPPDAAASYVPVATSQALDGVHPGVRRAILFIHDDDRNAAGNNATLATLAGGSPDTIIITPQFLLDSDLALYADQLPDKGKMFSRWVADQWAQGGDSVAAATGQGISSFAVMDMLMLLLADTKRFADLQQVVVAGIGSGGNFVHLYAAVGRASRLLTQQKLDLRYIVADASSYLYMTATRYQGIKKGFGIPDPGADATCAAYNVWPYGLDGLNDYARRTGVNAAKAAYAERMVVYLTSGAVSGAVAVGAPCPVIVQGVSPAARAENYAAYLRNIYGETIIDHHDFAIIPAARHDVGTLFGSSCGMAALFRDDPAAVRTLCQN